MELLLTFAIGSQTHQQVHVGVPNVLEEAHHNHAFAFSNSAGQPAFWLPLLFSDYSQKRLRVGGFSNNM